MSQPTKRGDEVSGFFGSVRGSTSACPSFLSKKTVEKLGGYIFDDHKCRHPCTLGEDRCGRDFLELEITDLEAVPVKHFYCCGEPLINVLRNPKLRSMDTNISKTLGLGLPTHEFAVLELTESPQSRRPNHKFLRLDYVDEDGGQVTAKLCPSWCGAVRTDLSELPDDQLPPDQLAQTRLVIFWECKFKDTCEQFRKNPPTTAAIVEAAEQLKGKYHVSECNCKTFISEAFGNLINQTDDECLANAWKAQLTALGQSVKTEVYKFFGHLQERVAAETAKSTSKHAA